MELNECQCRHAQLGSLPMLETQKNLHFILQRQKHEKNSWERTPSWVYKDQMKEIQYFLAWKGVFSSAWTCSRLVEPVFNSGRLFSRLKSGSKSRIVCCRCVSQSDSEEGISDHQIEPLNIKMPAEDGAYKKSGNVTWWYLLLYACVHVFHTFGLWTSPLKLSLSNLPEVKLRLFMASQSGFMSRHWF